MDPSEYNQFLNNYIKYSYSCKNLMSITADLVTIGNHRAPFHINRHLIWQLQLACLSVQKLNDHNNVLNDNRNSLAVVHRGTYWIEQWLAVCLTLHKLNYQNIVLNNNRNAQTVVHRWTYRCWQWQPAGCSNNQLYLSFLSVSFCLWLSIRLPTTTRANI